MTRQYNDPAGGTKSDMDGASSDQMNTFFYDKKALIEARKQQFFTQLADVTSMPKHMGKKIKKFHYIPMLDDQNLNDQGIDAAGAAISTSTWTVEMPRLVLAVANASKAAAATALADNTNGVTATAGADGSAGTGLATLTLSATTIKFANATKKDAALALNLGGVALQGSGNLYGSSKDIGLITGKLPTLSENGGRVNRVGFKRKELEGNLEKFGFFDEYTQESLDFDSDAELEQHVRREMVLGANEITEDALMIDLINAAGVVVIAGDATTTAEIGANDVVDYGDLMRLSITLDNNRTPKHTKVITGTRLIDTKTLPACRVLYCGSEMLPTFKGMVDLHSEPAWIPVQKYAAGGDTLLGEEGSVDNFRIVVVPEMVKWAGAGADATSDSTCYETAGRFDVFPLLVVGDESFTTIGFQTDGKTVKFKITHKKPGEETADRNDPYGEMGFMSIKWYYGFMALRPERIALIKTAAKL